MILYILWSSHTTRLPSQSPEQHSQFLETLLRTSVVFGWAFFLFCYTTEGGTRDNTWKWSGIFFAVHLHSLICSDHWLVDLGRLRQNLFKWVMFRSTFLSSCRLIYCCSLLLVQAKLSWPSVTPPTPQVGCSSTASPATLLALEVTRQKPKKLWCE